MGGRRGERGCGSGSDGREAVGGRSEKEESGGWKACLT